MKDDSWIALLIVEGNENSATGRGEITWESQTSVRKWLSYGQPGAKAWGAKGATTPVPFQCSPSRARHICHNPILNSYK